MGTTKSKPSGSAWFTTRGLSADFFGASPVASASGFRLGRDPAADNCNCTTEVLFVLRKPELSTLPGIGTFYFALTDPAGFRNASRSSVLGAFAARCLNRSLNRDGRAKVLLKHQRHRPSKTGHRAVLGGHDPRRRSGQHLGGYF